MAGLRCTSQSLVRSRRSRPACWGFAIALAVLLPLTGCGDPFSNQPFEDDAFFLSALPRLEQIEVQAPDTAEVARYGAGETDTAEAAKYGAGEPGTAGAAKGVDLEAELETCPADDPAFDVYRQFTLETVKEVNSEVKHLLERLDRIRQSPPNERTETSRVWGPKEVQAGVLARLEIVFADGLFTWRLTLVREDDAPASLIVGAFLPGSTAEDGEGEFVYDLAVESSYLDGVKVGQVAVDYSSLGAKLELHVDFVDVGAAGEPSSVVPLRTYAYAAPGDGSGRFYFDMPKDVGETGPGIEQVTVWSGWEADGRGRATVDYTGGDLPEGQVYSGEECWDSSGNPTWYMQPGSSGSTDPNDCGDSGTCIPSARGWNTPAGSARL